MTIMQKANLLKTELDDLRSQAVIINKAGGMSEIEVESDKVGYRKIEHYVGETLIYTDYIKDESETEDGTQDHPYTYLPPITLKQNAYYVHDGVRKVWMGEQDFEVAEGDTEVWYSEAFVEF